MIKFKQKKSDIIIPKATELRNSIAYEANQSFLRRGDVIIDYVNEKLIDVNIVKNQLIIKLYYIFSDKK